MTKWKETLQIGDIWAKLELEQMPLEDAAPIIASRISKLACYESSISIQEIHVQLMGFDESSDLDDLDELIETLYDWGDQDNRLFINTIELSEQV